MRIASLALGVVSVLLLSAGCIVHIGSGTYDTSHSWNRTAKRGSGVSVTQERPVVAFTHVRFACAGSVEVKVGGEARLSLTADDNLIDDLTTEVRDGVLVISTREGVNASFRVGPDVTISVPSLESLQIDGSGDGRVEGLRGENFAARIRGSGDLRAEGAVANVSVDVSGSGDADVAHVQSQHASVAIQGSGNVRVHSTESLTVAISGSGDVEYLGEPKRTSFSVSGSGDVRRGN